MKILLILIGVITVVFLWIARSGKTAWARPVSALSALIFLVLVIVNIMMIGTGNRFTKSIAQDAKYQSACGVYLGQSIANRHPGARVTILVPPGADSKGHKALIKDLSSALQRSGAQATVLAMDDEGNLTEPNQVVIEKELESIVGERPPEISVRAFLGVLEELEATSDVVVNAVTLSSSFGPDALPRKGEGVHLVLIYPGPMDYKKGLQESTLDTLILFKNNPDAWQLEANVPRRVEAAFHARFILAHADNPGILDAEESIFSVPPDWE